MPLKRGAIRLDGSAPVADETSAHLNRICRYLALDDFGRRRPHAGDLPDRIGAPRFDLIAVFGNQVLDTITTACALYAEGLASRVLFAGGVGHSTPLLFDNLRRSARYGHLVRSGALTAGMAEADMMATAATLEGRLPTAALLIENRSTNTGENARFGWELLGARLPRVRQVLLLQDPVMQRRTVLTMAKATGHRPQPPLLMSHAVFVPEVAGGVFVTPRSAGDPPPWESGRFLSLVLGEVERLRNDERGYGPNGKGFIPAEDVPAEVLASYEFLRTHSAVR